MRRGFDVLRETWSIGWFERVTRHLQIVGTRRGRTGSSRPSCASPTCSRVRSAIEERPITTSYRVVPRIVAVRSAFTDSVIGSIKATKGLYEEPSLFAGVRPYRRATSCGASTGGRRLASAFRSAVDTTRRASVRC